MLAQVQNTLGLENGFNDLRDNEVRSARHKTRSPNYLQAVANRNMDHRYKDSAPLVDVAPETHGKVRSAH
eukprot:5310070-Lingulodinium_polyedra.AAC.1